MYTKKATHPPATAGGTDRVQQTILTFETKPSLIGPPGYGLRRQGHKLIQGFGDHVHLYFFHRPVSLNHNVWPKLEAELLRISRTKQPHTRNARHVGHMQHARINADEEVRFRH